MIQNSYISDKQISKSLSRLNKISSNKKFRVKSLRIKTEQNSSSHTPIKNQTNFPSLSQIKQQSTLLYSPIKPINNSNSNIISTILINNKLRVKSTIIQKDYEHQLQTKLHIPKSIVQQVFKLKLQHQQVKLTDEKYQQFCKMLFLRLNDRIQICVETFNFRNMALERFLQFLLIWKRANIISLDLSLCSQLAYKIRTKYQEDIQLMNNNNNNNSNNNSNNKTIKTQPQLQQPLWPMNSLLISLIHNTSATKLSLRNIHLTPQQTAHLLQQILLSKRIYSLDISNKTSQSINRLGSEYSYLQQFFTRNEFAGIIKMDNLNINDQCMLKISNGITRNIFNTHSPLTILSLSGNLLTQKSVHSIYNIITRTRLTQLNLSNNPLKQQFYLQLNNLRATTLNTLDLSSTQMNSQSLIHLLTQLSQNKTLSTLKLDNNDFSHHYFNKIDQLIANNLYIKELSFVNCQIKNFSSLFDGIAHSRYLTKLNLNYNLVNLDSQQIEKVVYCLKNNKTLKQLRIKFCGYNQSIFIQILQSLLYNKTLELIDISENHLSDQGAKYITKLLHSNKSIKEIIIEKLQLTVKITQQIKNLLSHNKQQRQKLQFSNLIDQNHIYKSRDILAWNDILKLQEQAKKLQGFTLQVKERNTDLEQKISIKRQFIMEMKKTVKIEEKRIQREIKKQQQQLLSMIRKTNLEIQKITQKQQQSLQAKTIQQNLIHSLQQKIQKQNQKIKRRQHQLQEQFRDHKYLQKRKDKLQKLDKQPRKQSQDITKIKSSNSSQIFDNTKSYRSLTKRKSSTIHKKE